MQKMLAVFFCTTFLFGLAANVFAIHIEAPAETSSVIAKGGLVTLDGNIRHRGYLSSTSAKKDDTKQRAGIETRVRLGTTVKTGDQIAGRVVLETGSGTRNFYTWGEDNSNGLHDGGYKKGALEVQEAWVQYEPGNWGLKVGHMPLALGNKIFYDHTKFGDDAIVAFMNPNNAIHIAALTIKLEEGPSPYTKYSDDINGYVLLGTFKAGAMNFGADWTYLTKGADEISVFAGMSFSNIGLRGNIDAGGFKIKGDIEFQAGELYDDQLDKAGKTVTNIDAGGWAGMLEASTKVGGAFDVGGALFYGSGQKHTDPVSENNGFVNFLGALRYQSTMNGFILGSPANVIPGTTTALKNRGIANQTQLQVYCSAMSTCPLTGKDLSLKARLNWMKVNEEQYANQEDDIGTEIELFAVWKLAQGLVYGIEAAYLFTGDAWKTAPIVDVDNVFFLRHRLELTW